MKVKILLKSKVSISQLVKILPFVCVILLSGCSVLEESEGFISSQNTTNKDAARFIKTINNQPDQLSLYRNLLADYQPMYDLVKMKYGSEHGMYYFVPYCEPVSAEVKGAIYYPVEYSIDEDDKVTLKDILKSPKLVNADAINNKIPITQRFLYSHSFAELMGQGQKVDEDLLSYEFLNDSVMSIVDGMPNWKTRTVGDGAIEIKFLYESHYVGPADGHIYGLSLWTLNDFLYSLLWGDVKIDHDGYGSFILIIPIKDVDSRFKKDYDWFVRDLMFNIRERARFQLEFDLTLQYTYTVYLPNEIITGDNKPHYGETGGYGSWESDSQKRDKRIAEREAADKGFKEDCNSIQGAQIIKNEFKSITDNLFKAKDTKIGENSYISFSTFTNAIWNNNKVEYGIQAKDYGDGNIYIGPVQVDEKSNSVTISRERSTILTCHNHPNQTPPSPQDLKMLCEIAADETSINFKCVSIYNDSDDTFYGLLLIDREKAAKLFEILKDDIDENNDFKKDGICDNILSYYARDRMLKKLSPPGRMIARLIIILKVFNGGIKVVKYNREDSWGPIAYDITDNNELVRCK